MSILGGAVEVVKVDWISSVRREEISDWSCDKRIDERSESHERKVVLSMLEMVVDLAAAMFS